MLDSLSHQLEADLQALDVQGRRRTLPTIAGDSRVQIDLHGARLVSFCSNDYLGLSSDPRILAASAAAAATFGFGAGASRLVAGDLPPHRTLEDALTILVGLPAALLFPTGYQANLGLISALAGPDDLIVADRAIHASLIDGSRLSRAKLALYPHLDLDKAQHHLTRLGPRARRRLLVTESLFSMDGDIAPLGRLAALAREHDAALIVDEAHALGVFGPFGGGLCVQAGVVPDALIGTFGKAFASAGAFVAGTSVLRDYLVNKARTFIFTTALPPPVAAAATAAIAVSSSQEGSSRRANLANLVKSFRSALELPADPANSPIVPIVLGADQAAVQAAHGLRAQGIFVQPIRPPTVRNGTARLRLTFSAAHTPEHVLALASAIRRIHTTQSTEHHPPPPREPGNDQSEGKGRPVRGLFLAGTDTGVGKTAVGTALLRYLANRGERPVPFKPIETGAQPTPRDAAALLEAAARTDLPLGVVCPIPLRDPVAPALAAAAEHADTSLATLHAHFVRATSHGSPVIVESAGGLLTPYAPGITGADLADSFHLPVLLVARNSLGTINHTALAVAELRRRASPLIGVILVNVSPETSPDQHGNAALIHDVTGIRPLGVLPYLPHATPERLARHLERSVDLAPVLAVLLPSPSPNGASPAPGALF